MNSESDYAQRGAEALVKLKNLDTGNPPEGLFEQVVSSASQQATAHHDARRFWSGAGLGLAVAASIFAVAMTFGWIGAPTISDPDTAQFYIAQNESRQMDIAIETDQALLGATIRILVAGSVEVDGFGNQREITWVDDLYAGTNRISLPLVATGSEGGTVVVLLSHPKSEQIFIVNLKSDG